MEVGGHGNKIKSVDTNDYSLKCFASQVLSLVLIFAVAIKTGTNGAVCSRCMFIDTPLPVLKPTDVLLAQTITSSLVRTDCDVVRGLLL